MTVSTLDDYPELIFMVQTCQWWCQCLQWPVWNEEHGCTLCCYIEQSTFQYTQYAESCTQHFYHHRFSETLHRLQIILALVIPNHNTPAFCNKGAVVLINNVMATSEVTKVRISCGTYQSNSWPKILVCGIDTPQVLCNIYNSPCG
jgi:hypothetical protein